MNREALPVRHSSLRRTYTRDGMEQSNEIMELRQTNLAKTAIK